MDIAEIRKKVRSGKNTVSSSAIAPEMHDAEIRLTNSVTEKPQPALHKLTEPCQFTEVVAISPIVQTVPMSEGAPILSPSATAYRDSVEQLFSWNPETEIA